MTAPQVYIAEFRGGRLLPQVQAHGRATRMKAFELGDWCLIGIILLELCAVLAYVHKRRWLEAIVYTCYLIAQSALLALSLRSR